MIFDSFKTVYDFLEDDLSKKIFSAKAEWFYRGGVDETNQLLYEYYSHSRILDLERYPIDVSYVICGAGQLGHQTFLALSHAGYKVKYFLDNDKTKVGKVKDGIVVKSFVDFVCNDEEDTIVIIDNMGLSASFFSELCGLGFPQERIYRTNDNIVRSAFGNIYFDLPNLRKSEKEIFIDAGCYDGQSSMEFMKWCGNRCEKIYAFEPMSDAFTLAKFKLRNVSNVELYQCALGDTVGETSFAESYTVLQASRIGTAGNHVERVRLETIDHFLNGAEATFIKMDIEGAELSALKGSESTLKKYHPNLAISLYHNKEDLYEIPLWVKENVPDYKMYIRHYSNKRWDMVLYCVAE